VQHLGVQNTRSVPQRQNFSGLRLAHQRTVGCTHAYSRWQFRPTLPQKH
jgi:hypothetical protein